MLWMSANGVLLKSSRLTLRHFTAEVNVSDFQFGKSRKVIKSSS